MKAIATESANGDALQRKLDVADWFLVLATGLFFLAVVYSSLGWRITSDAPVMLYQAFLVDHFGFVPYRDFFDMNLPGTYLLYLLIGKVFGYSDPGLRIADLLILSALGFATAATWWRLSPRAGLLAGSLVGLRYLSFGPELSLQREILVLTPIALAAAFAMSSMPLRWRSGLAGVAIGMAATIQPHAAIGLLPIGMYLAAEARASADRRDALVRTLAAGSMGFAVPLFVVLGWILWAGVLGDFVHSLGYLEYYAALNGAHQTTAGVDRWAYLVRSLFELGGFAGWWVTAWLVLAWAWLRAELDPGQRRRLLLFAGMLFVYTLYPTASGQFWVYHWLPMNYWIAASLPFLLLPVSSASSPWMKVAPRLALLVAVAVLTAAYPGSGSPYFAFAKQASPENQRADEIARFLEDNVRPGETVQAMDWVFVGVSHGMLMAQVRPATRFLYTFHFYHHVSTPYIKDLRRQYLAQFDEARPAFVIEGHRGRRKPWVRGLDTSRTWPAAEKRLREGYIVVFERKFFSIWERKDRAAAGESTRGKPEAPPNVLLLTVDTLRPDYLSFNGYDRETSPNLDALIRKGTWFSRAVAPVPRTTPALASLVTGLHPHHHGIRRLFDNLNTNTTTLAQVAKQNGYQTAAIISNHVVKPKRGLNAGFDFYDNRGDGRTAEKTTRDALSRMLQMKPEQAMFVWVHYIDPHVPYRPPKKYIEAFDSGYQGPYAQHFGGRPGSVGDEAYPRDLPKAEAVFHNSLPDRVNEHIRRAYAADIRQTDDAIGSLLDGIEADRGSNWVVVFTADHGESLGEHNYFYDHGDYVYDAGVHIPLAFVDLRDARIESRKVDNWVSLIDVAPTLADWLGWSWPTPQDGRSLMPALRDEALDPLPVFAESGMNFLAGHVPRRVTLDVKGRFRAVMLGDKKLIYTPGASSPWELYDLKDDPRETVNRWANEAGTEEAEALVAALQVWMADDKMAELPAAPSASDVEALKALGYMIEDTKSAE